MAVKNKEFFKSSTVVGAICIVAALLIGFVITPAYNRAVDRSVTIVRATTQIPEGTQITKDMVATVTVGRNNLPTGTLTDPNSVIGKYATVTISENDDITNTKLSDTDSRYDLEDGYYLISVSIKDFADGLSGQLHSGDIVSIYTPVDSSSAKTIQDGTADSSETTNNPPELQYVKVVAVTTSNGTNVNAKDDTTDSTSTSSSSSVPSTVTLLVNPEQASIIAGYDSSSLHFALVSRGDDGQAEKLLQEQNGYFTSSSASSGNENGSEASSNPASSSATGASSVSSATTPAEEN